ncbi:cytokine-dependent hematopoietic cell linker [Camarhynchus parvulus]|uniref:cytokine-dependent hematopoietic cell linker n=1 Tax=Geospiza parvula TaxID=87175 RepID=UPI001237D784|nr:cytokine-dependent hematopoietic cell linker [Camarhynchus parvulus]
MNPNRHRKEKRTTPANTFNSSEYLTMKGKSDFQLSSELSEEEDNMYETVNSSVLEAIHSLRILPAKPLQESEYADTRCLRPSGTTSPTSENPYQPPQHSAIHTFDPEGRTVPNVRGGRMKPHGYQEPTPPPRPLKMLPKQYQPLPPEPRISSQVLHKRNTLSRDPTFPISAEVTRHSCVRKSNTAPGRQQVTSLGKKPEVPFQAQHHSPEASPQCTWSSKNICRSGSTLSVDNLTVKKPPPPTSYAACKNKSKHLLAEQKMQSLTKSTEKDLNKCEWYVGEYDRHKAEKILLQKNTDETFLVRDCSKKSKAEPYVLVVYYGRRVYNIKVRFLEESQQYALGTGLRGDCKFNSVEEIIDFYRSVPITLIDGRDQSGNHREQCYLTHPFKAC